MGGLAGHIDFGTSFSLLAIWWLVNGIKDYILAERKGHTMRPLCSYTLRCKREIPVEIFLKALFPTILFWVEFRWPLVDEQGNFRDLNFQQHRAIYALFAIHGFVDLFTYYRFPVIPDLNKVTLLLSFFWFGLAFYYHANAHGKSEFEVTVHEMPTWILYSVAFIGLLELRWREGIWTLLARSYLVLTFGTWFSHVGFMLDRISTFSARNDPRNLMFVKAMFAFHLFVNLLICVSIYVIVSLVLFYKKRVYLKMPKYGRDPRPFKNGQLNGHSYLAVPSDGKLTMEDTADDSTFTLLDHEADQFH